ncbi:MAG: hypothetical protein C0501_26065 [Isosphaera sp.]|nr:hypothetical protein [Isosphaera sp.]
MGHKRDITQSQAIAEEFGMDVETRFEFGDYIEECKRQGDRGSGKRGDFTYAELRAKAREFLGLGDE